MRVDARALLIKSNTLGVDPLVDKILSTEQNAEKALYIRALDINKSALKRRYLESCLLASEDIARISFILELPEELIIMYREIFYAVSGLDKLSKLELLDVKDREEHAMKLWALSQGLEFIEWRLGHSVIVNPVDGLQELFTMSMYKAKEALFSGNASEASREGKIWTKLSVDMARLLKTYVLDTEGAKKDIELALAQVVPNFGSFSDLDREDLLPPDSGDGPEIPELPELPDFPSLPQD
jgi:hypothetical protein